MALFFVTGLGIGFGQGQNVFDFIQLLILLQRGYLFHESGR